MGVGPPRGEPAGRGSPVARKHGWVGGSSEAGWVSPVSPDPPAHPSQSAKFFHQVLIRHYNLKIENTEKIRKDLKIKKQFESGKLDLIVYLLDPMAQNL